MTMQVLQSAIVRLTLGRQSTHFPPFPAEKHVFDDRAGFCLCSALSRGLLVLLMQDLAHVAGSAVNNQTEIACEQDLPSFSGLNCDAQSISMVP